MSRRCKAGQRARIILKGDNHNLVVVVVRPYFGEKLSDGHTWVMEAFPWVVTSLSRPIASHFHRTNEAAAPSMTGVMDDTALQPLDDDDDGLDESTDTDKPVERPKPVTA